MEELSQRELRNDSGRIMRALRAGQRFVVNSNGEPVAELVPLRRSRFVDRQAVLDVFHRGPALSLEALRHDLDDHVDQDVTPRG